MVQQMHRNMCWQEKDGKNSTMGRKWSCGIVFSVKKKKHIENSQWLKFKAIISKQCSPMTGSVNLINCYELIIQKLLCQPCFSITCTDIVSIIQRLVKIKNSRFNKLAHQLGKRYISQVLLDLVNLQIRWTMKDSFWFKKYFMSGELQKYSSEMGPPHLKVWQWGYKHKNLKFKGWQPMWSLPNGKRISSLVKINKYNVGKKLSQHQCLTTLHLTNAISTMKYCCRLTWQLG